MLDARRRVPRPQARRATRSTSATRSRSPRGSRSTCPEVGAGERTRFRVVLLDEYQDTSYAQLTLLGALFGGGHPVTAVGDPHQSIYGWRGASAGGLEGFPTSFPQVARRTARASPADVHQLSTSWRNDRAHPRGRQPRRRRRCARRHPGRRCRCSPPGRAPATGACTRTSPRRSRTRRRRSRSSSPSGGGPPDAAARPGDRGGAVPQALAVRAARARAARRAGSRSRSSGSAGCSPRPRWSTSSPLLQAAHDPSRGDALMRLLTGARTRLGAADLHALAAWAGELAARHGGDAAVAERRDGRVDDDVVVEADVVDERSIVDALDGSPSSRPRAGRSRGGRTLSAVGRARLADLAGLLRALRSHTYLSRARAGRRGRAAARARHRGRRPGRHARRAARARTSTRSATSPSSSPGPPTTRPSAASSPGSRPPTPGSTASTCRSPSPTRTPCSSSPCTRPRGSSGTSSRSPGLVDGGLPATATAGQGRTEGLGVAHRARLAAVPAARRPPRPAGVRVRRRRRPEGPRGAPQAVRARRRRARGRRGAPARLRRADPRPDRPAAHRGLVGRRHAGPQGLDVPRPSSPRPGWSRPTTGPAAPDDGATNPRASLRVTATWPADPFAHRRWAGPPRARRGRGRAGPRRDGDVAHAGGDSADGATPVDPRPVAGGRSRWDVLADRLLAERERARTPVRRRRAARAPVGVGARPARRRPGRVRAAPAPPGAGRAVAAGPPRHPVPRVGRGLVRRGVARRRRRPARRGRRLARPSTSTSAALRDAFLATPVGATASPLAVEVDVETPVAGYVLRSRIDAVFADPRRGRRAAGRRRRRLEDRRAADGRRRRGPPARSSSRCTGWRGRAGRAPRSTTSAPRSATSARA